jgi:hypothetical protein
VEIERLVAGRVVIQPAPDLAEDLRGQPVVLGFAFAGG